MIVSHKRSTNMSKLYACVMTTPIAEVRCVGVWNVIVAWHRGVHMGRASESLAECAGSVLKHMELKWKGCHPRNVRELIWAANFRMAGLRGVSGEEGFLATALNVHFQNFWAGTLAFSVSEAVPANQWQWQLGCETSIGEGGCEKASPTCMGGQLMARFVCLSPSSSCSEFGSTCIEGCRVFSSAG